jgi:excisionase family DNA binding protein
MAMDELAQRELPTVLDAQQVAQLLSLNIDYVRRLSRQGVIPAHRIQGGRRFHYFKDEILDWLRRQPVHHDQDAAHERERAT